MLREMLIGLGILALCALGLWAAARVLQVPDRDYPEQPKW